MAQAAEQSALSSGSDAVSVSVSVSDCDLSSGSGLKCCCKYYSASASASASYSLSLSLSVRKRLLNLLYNLVSILFPQSELPVFFGFCARFVPVRRRSLSPHLSSLHATLSSIIENYIIIMYSTRSSLGFVCAHIFTVMLRRRSWTLSLPHIRIGSTQMQILRSSS